jgi:hypothetical protein
MSTTVILTSTDSDIVLSAQLEMIKQAASVKTPMFVSIIGYSNDKSNGTEKADYLLNIGIDYYAAKKKDTDFLANKENLKLIKFGHYQAFGEIAWDEMYKAITGQTVDSRTRSAAQTDAYFRLPGVNNIRIHKETGRVYIDGLVIRKTVKEKGTYKETNSALVTLAKNCIRKSLKCSKYREFAIDKISDVKINGNRIQIFVD